MQARPPMTLGSNVIRSNMKIPPQPRSRGYCTLPALGKLAPRPGTPTRGRRASPAAPTARHTIRARPSPPAADDAAPQLLHLQALPAHRLVGQELGGRALEHDAAVAHHVEAVRNFKRDGQLL